MIEPDHDPWPVGTTVITNDHEWAADLAPPLGKATSAGNLVADAHLAALTIEHGATLWSADREFGWFVGLDWMNPLAL